MAMRNNRRLILGWTAAMSAWSLSLSDGLRPFTVQWQLGQSAIARSSGGRAGGGSFRRSSPPSRSAPSQSAPRNTSPNVSQPNYRPPGNYGGPIFVPPPVYYPSQPRSDSAYSHNNGQNNTNGGNIWLGLLVLLILGGVSVAAVLWLWPKLTGKSASSMEREIENNIFTVTKLQVALYAQARDIQTDLSALSAEIDTSDSEGLLRLLQESVLALLRHPESWTHVSAHSETAPNALDAERRLNQLSMTERSRLSAETLVSVGGQVQRRAIAVPDGEGPAAYIVVSFLLGTVHDRPLFDQVRSVAELKAILENVAALPADYLMAFELIWSPQDPSDSLTDDELLTEYSDLILL